MGIGLACGFAFAALLHGIILFTRFITKRSTGIKILCVFLWPLTFAAIMYFGILSYIPYAIYNLIKILLPASHRPSDQTNPEALTNDPKQGVQNGNKDS